MSYKIIDVKHISKRFGEAVALEDISFSIEKGQIFGFLGPSGSGKTTTINILTGQLAADKGQSLILGKASQQLSSNTLEQIGLVSDSSGSYEKMTLYNNLLFYSKFYQVAPSRLDDLLKRVGLYDSRKKAVEKLSTGMKQRMLLARALINQPEVLFLDEPTSGLDPATSRTIHDLILELKAAGTTIFLTTHDMHEATLLCDNLALLNKGVLVEQGSPENLIQKYNTDKKVTITYQDKHQLTVAFSELASTLAGSTEEMIAIHSCEPTLEDIFITLTGGKLNV
ncbi:ABC transporter ATP-binding protein [Streptococcus macacae]|uniref:ABC transporter, ATP-binding protein n=1 Tax=Streptococcus macacae NCTC 11558 TaxID=764298 RepID=G5JW23_9STRE|nr:ABC transporter ATP-binding protein [Streptococcus macacae]EHJ53064.1 ABC transporter, ATP-binding protein [Streptococcus macacae NCTC 11558]SUN79357.1 ABC transporter ATP-binding protein [Streptococcus macacae NCTC 11558]